VARVETVELDHAARTNIFEIESYDGAPVALGAQEWKNKIISDAPIGHPEVADYLNVIRSTISDPDVVFESTKRDDTRLLYKLSAGYGDYDGKHLVIVVKYVEEADGLRGYVSTAYLARGLYAGGRILWQKRNLIGN